MTLRLREPGRGTSRPLRIGRPFASVGRTEGSDLRIDDRDVGSRHAYLHLDGRGLLVVDLATRTGTRVGGAAVGAAWLRAGQSFEVAGRRVEILGLRLDGAPLAPPAPGATAPADPLADSGGAALPRVTLLPAHGGDAPWALNSELVFFGRSQSCGVRIEGERALRVHGVLVRTPRGAHVVDLAGRDIQLNGRPVAGASALADGDELTLGGSRFRVRVEPTGAPATGAPSAVPDPATAVPTTELIPAAALPPLPPGLVPDEAQAALAAWMLGVIQTAQAELDRRQERFEREVVHALRQMHRDNQDALSRHLHHIESIHRELADLKEDVRRRYGPAAPPADAPALPKPPPLRIAPTPPAPADPAVATQWLLSRVGQIDQEGRASWKELLARLGRPRRQA